MTRQEYRQTWVRAGALEAGDIALLQGWPPMEVASVAPAVDDIGFVVIEWVGGELPAFTRAALLPMQILVPIEPGFPTTFTIPT